MSTEDESAVKDELDRMAVSIGRIAIAMRFVAAFGLIGAAYCFYLGTLSGHMLQYFSAMALVVVSIWMFYQANATNRRLRQRMEKYNSPSAH